MEAIMITLREEIVTAKATEKVLKSELSTLSSVASAEYLRATVEALQTQKEGLLARLQDLKKVEVKPVTEKERVAAEEAHKMWKRHASARKTIVKELWFRCLDLLPDRMTKEDLWVGVLTRWKNGLTLLQEQLGCEGKMP